MNTVAPQLNRAEQVFLKTRGRTPAIDHHRGEVEKSEHIDLANNEAHAQLGFYAHLLKPSRRQGKKKKKSLAQNHRKVPAQVTTASPSSDAVFLLDQADQ